MFLVQGLPEEVRAGPKAYRAAVWTMAFDFFFSVETFFACSWSWPSGPNLVSQDLRFNAMPLYFSRPIRRIDYFLGKLGVIAVFLAAVAVAPAVAAYVLGVAFSLDSSVIRDTWRLLARVGRRTAWWSCVSAGTLMLAISSLSRNSRLVGATWVGLWVVSNVDGRASSQQTVRQDWCPVVSYTANLDRDPRGAARHGVGPREVPRPLCDVGPRVGPRGDPPAVPVRPGPEAGRPAAGPPGPSEDAAAAGATTTTGNVRQPWTWSAGVLAGLFVLSAWTLSTRVKSLDRLR